MCGVEGFRHRLLSLEGVSKFLEREYPHWLSRLEERFGSRGAAAEFRSRVEDTMENHQGVEDRLRRVALAARDVVQNVRETRVHAVYRAMLDNEETGGLAAQVLASAYNDTGGRWLTAVADPFIAGCPAVSGLEFCEAVRVRVLAPFRGDGTVDVLCDCHHQGQEPIDLHLNPGHPDMCRRNGNVTSGRHDAVVRRLAALIKRGSDPGVVVTVEPQVGPGERQPDIKVERNGGTTYIDVVIASPISAGALAHGSRERLGVAAEEAEARKRSDYAGCAHEVVPFAIETYGHLGKAAKTYLQRLSPKLTMDQMASFYKDISHILAFHLGRAHLMCRQRSGGGYRQEPEEEEDRDA